MKRFMIVALGVVVLGVAGAVWLAGNTAPPPLEPPEPVVSDPPFEYPIELWDQGVEGEAVVMVHVDRTGRVDSVYVLQSSGEAAFDSVATAGAWTIPFRAGRRGEEAVDAWVRLPVRFRMPAPENDTPVGSPDE